MRPTRTALATHAPWLRAVAVTFFAIAVALLGASAGLMPGARVAALGWSLVALGVAYAGSAFASDGAQARGLLASGAAAYGVSGSLLLVEPFLGALLLFAAVAVALTLGGIGQAAAAAAERHAQWTTAFASGLAIAAFGVAVALRWPLSAVSALATTFGLAAAAQGAACLRLAAAGERLAWKNLLGLRKNPGTRQPSGACATCMLPFGRQTY